MHWPGGDAHEQIREAQELGLRGLLYYGVETGAGWNVGLFFGVAYRVLETLSIFAEILVTTNGGPGVATTNLTYLIYVSSLLKQYFTDDKILETLEICE
mgnify:CR=1 FL=1